MADKSAETEAIQAVVDRVSSYQDGAPETTIKDELARGLDEAGVSVDDVDLDRLADAIEERGGDIDVATILS